MLLATVALLLEWAGSALVGELIGEARRRLQTEDWRRRFANRVVDAADDPDARSAVGAWLAEEATWAGLVQPTPGAVDALQASLAGRLDAAPQVPVVGASADDTRSKRAGRLVRAALQQFLTELDPSRAIAVQEVRRAQDAEERQAQDELLEEQLDLVLIKLDRVPHHVAERVAQEIADPGGPFAAAVIDGVAQQVGERFDERLVGHREADSARAATVRLAQLLTKLPPGVADAVQAALALCRGSKAAPHVGAAERLVEWLQRSDAPQRIGALIGQPPPWLPTQVPAVAGPTGSSSSTVELGRTPDACADARPRDVAVDPDLAVAAGCAIHLWAAVGEFAAAHNRQADQPGAAAQAVTQAAQARMRAETHAADLAAEHARLGGGAAVSGALDPDADPLHPARWYARAALSAIGTGDLPAARQLLDLAAGAGSGGGHYLVGVVTAVLAHEDPASAAYHDPQPVLGAVQAAPDDVPDARWLRLLRAQVLFAAADLDSALAVLDGDVDGPHADPRLSTALLLTARCLITRAAQPGASGDQTMDRLGDLQRARALALEARRRRA